MLTPRVFRYTVKHNPLLDGFMKLPNLAGLPLALFRSSLVIVNMRTAPTMHTESLKLLSNLYTVSFRPQTCRDFTCQVTSIVSLG